MAAEIAARHNADGLSAKAAAKAREAKRRKRAGDGLGQSDDPLDEESAEYRARERDMIAGLRLQRRKERGDRRGRPSRLEPVDALIWGAHSDPPSPKSTWDDRYLSLASRGQRRFYEGGALAFAETRNLVTLYSNNRQHQIDALLLAQAKFGTIQIDGTRKQRRQLIELAVQLGIPLAATHEAEAGKYRSARVKVTEPKVATRAADLKPPVSPAQREGRSTPRDLGHEPTAQQVNRRTDEQRQRFKLRLADLRYQDKRDQRARRRRLETFTATRLESLEARNQIAVDDARWRHSRNAEPNVARNTLERIDRNRLLLASSRDDQGGYRFLDDEELRFSFASKPQHLLLPSVQEHLGAIRAIQIEQRMWIAAALLEGRVKLVDGKLEAAVESDRWAEAFWAAQGSDASFQRLVALSTLFPNRFAFDLDQTPEIMAWRKSRQQNSAGLATHIVHEMNRSAMAHGDAAVPVGAKMLPGQSWTRAREEASDVYRRNILSKLSADERDALRNTPSPVQTPFPQNNWPRDDSARKGSGRRSYPKSIGRGR